MSDLTVRDLADRLNVSEASVNRLVRDGELPQPLNPTARRRRRWRINDVEAFEQERELRNVAEGAKAFADGAGVHPKVRQFLLRSASLLVNPRVASAERHDWAGMMVHIRGTGRTPTEKNLADLAILERRMDQLEGVRHVLVEVGGDDLCSAVGTAIRDAVSSAFEAEPVRDKILATIDNAVIPKLSEIIAREMAKSARKGRA